MCKWIADVNDTFGVNILPGQNLLDLDLQILKRLFHAIRNNGSVEIIGESSLYLTAEEDGVIQEIRALIENGAKFIDKLEDRDSVTIGGQVIDVGTAYLRIHNPQIKTDGLPVIDVQQNNEGIHLSCSSVVLHIPVLSKSEVDSLATAN
ncbi:MAG: hypothetical protein NUW37_14025 [Planctomycetes bacterium]|nr:hypothetical protein [Planctomycetota bacterium]